MASGAKRIDRLGFQSRSQSTLDARPKSDLGANDSDGLGPRGDGFFRNATTEPMTTGCDE